MRFLLCLCLLLTLITTSSKAQYYFIFKARGIGEAFQDCEGKAQKSVFGHAFVSLVRRDEGLRQTIVDSTWGFTLNQRGVMALVSTPGHLETTCVGDLGSADFIVEVDRATYEYAKNLKSKWVAKQYGIFANVNCVDFVKAMLELVTPDVKLPEVLKMYYLNPGVSTGAALVKQWYKVPKPFLYQLRTLNIKRDAESRASLSRIPEKNEHQEELNLYSNIGTENFNIFIQKFSTDKDFQINRIRFPITWTELEDYRAVGKPNKNIKTFFTKENWKYINITKSTKKYPYISEIYPPSREYPTRNVVEMCKTEECQEGLQYIFTLLAGKWYLKEVHWFFA